MKLERFHGMTMRLFFQKILGLIRHEVDIENIRTPFGEPFNENAANCCLSIPFKVSNIVIGLKSS